MSGDNYQSPYGFGVVTDAVIDCIADRRGVTSQEFADRFERLTEEQREELQTRVDFAWWQDYMGYAVDKMEDLLSEFIDLEPVTD